MNEHDQIIADLEVLRLTNQRLEAEKNALDKAEAERCAEIVRLQAENEQLQLPRLARHQPCGCIICICPGEKKCYGCGAKNCGVHPPGEIPNPIYEPHPLHTEIARLEADRQRLVVEVERMKERESPDNRRSAAWYWFKRAAVEWLGISEYVARSAFEMRWSGDLSEPEAQERPVMTARNKNDLRSLIEKARKATQTLLSGTYQAQTRQDLTSIRNILDQALSLLPDADESASNWQEFDPNREETWPKEEGGYAVTTRLYPETERIDVKSAYWNKGEWHQLDCEDVLAYQPLPPPYVKP